jgi:7,8-didemethyl-8-hydroxy-5-deazariboflavin synthase CofG subunit
VERAEAIAALEGVGPADEGLLARARDVRDEAYGRFVTYSRKVFIPLTNLCRDTCGYCTFAKAPGSPGAGYMSPDEILAVARAGRAVGCKEALFSLGERPELRWPEAREALARLGHTTTLGYLREMCELVLRETGLVPHANPGTLSEDEMRELLPVTGSMGMMLETVSERLMGPGGAHHRCPDKAPRRRLATLEAAGRLGVPFTTGILIGIGETAAERADSLLAIARVHAARGTIQEVIVQNFRRKPDIAMADAAEPGLDDMLRTLAVARLILPPEVSLQAPPNLMPEQPASYILAGLDDWGGVSPVTPDHINPEAAWPAITALAEATASAGYELRERLTVRPRFLRDPARHLAPEMRPYLASLAGPDGLARDEVLR